VSELASLRLADVALSARKGHIVVRRGHLQKHREVDLNSDARRAIKDCIEKRPNVEDDHLFIDQRGQDLQSRGIQFVVAKYAEVAGLEDVGPHVFRHTFAEQFLDAGENLVTVATLMAIQDWTPQLSTPSLAVEIWRRQ